MNDDIVNELMKLGIYCWVEDGEITFQQNPVSLHTREDIPSGNPTIEQITLD